MGNGINVNWKNAEEITKNDSLMYPIEDKKDTTILHLTGNRLPRDKRYREKIKKELLVDGDYARMMGLYLAEGCISERGIRFTFNNNETELHKFIIKCAYKYFNRVPTLEKRWATTLHINMNTLPNIFKNMFGEKANEKRLPQEIYNWNTKNKISFLMGYIDGDGHIYEGGDATITTSSKKLSQDIIKLSNSLNLTPIITERKPRKSIMKDGRIINSEK